MLLLAPSFASSWAGFALPIAQPGKCPLRAQHLVYTFLGCCLPLGSMPLELLDHSVFVWFHSKQNSDLGVGSIFEK
jgi:hypothetical protein